MNDYYKLHLAYSLRPTLLNRIIYVRTDTKLDELAAIFLLSLNIQKKEKYAFKDGVSYFYSNSDDIITDRDFSSKGVSIDELKLNCDNDFDFSYDLDDSWDFNVQVDRNIYRMDSDRKFVLESANGKGIIPGESFLFRKYSRESILKEEEKMALSLDTFHNEIDLIKLTTFIDDYFDIFLLQD